MDNQIDNQMHNQMDNHWRFYARCRGADTEMFFSTRRSDQSLATALYCERCPVRAPCRDLALATEGELAYGIFGGLTAPERQALRPRARGAPGPTAA